MKGRSSRLEKKETVLVDRYAANYGTNPALHNNSATERSVCAYTALECKDRKTWTNRGVRALIVTTNALNGKQREPLNMFMLCINIVISRTVLSIIRRE